MDRTTALDPHLTNPVARAAAWAAAERAVESLREDALFDDPLAEDFALSAGIDIFDELAPAMVRGGRSLVAHRTRFLDDFVLRCTRTEGFRQVVMLGAGYDARSFRLDFPSNTVVFEVDTPDVFRHKNITLDMFDVEADCDRRVVEAALSSPWHNELLAAGFDQSTPTAWIADGTFEHYDNDVVRAIIASAAHLSIAESRFGTDIADRSAAEPATMLEQCGWHADVVARPAETSTTYLRFQPDARSQFELRGTQTFFTASTRLTPRQ